MVSHINHFKHLFKNACLQWQGMNVFVHCIFLMCNSIKEMCLCIFIVLLFECHVSPDAVESASFMMNTKVAFREFYFHRCRKYVHGVDVMWQAYCIAILTGSILGSIFWIALTCPFQELALSAQMKVFSASIIYQYTYIDQYLVVLDKSSRQPAFHKI